MMRTRDHLNIETMSYDNFIRQYKLFFLEIG